MDKKEIISLAEAFMQEAFQANCYIDIIEQYSRNSDEYFEEMRISGAFYHFTRNALVVATFMELAKIFDSHRASINIKQLMDICVDNMQLFPNGNKVILGGEEKIFPYRHTVSSGEEDFFQKEIEIHKPINELFGGEGLPITVDMSVEKYFELFVWKYGKIKPKISNLLKQRNKIYAHNDKDSLRNIDKTIKEFPISRSDVNAMTEFATEFSRFVIALLTGVNKAATPVNIDDWQNTLRLVRLGNKYIDVEIKNSL